MRCDRDRCSWNCRKKRCNRESLCHAHLSKANLDTIHKDVIEVCPPLNGRIGESSHVRPNGRERGELAVLQLKLRVDDIPVLPVPDKQGDSPAGGREKVGGVSKAPASAIFQQTW